ncbi:MAG: hypothetical protein AAB353_06860, partial [Candidatus Hydrogenedentota bacterium]
GSVVGASIYRVDPETGDSETYIGPLEGMADDLEFGADGTLVWTSFMSGILRARTGEDGPIRQLASGLPGINSVAFNQDGRLFATQVFLGDALYEVDPAGKKPLRKILENIGGLNGFDFGPDGLLYGPLWFRGQVVKIDVDSAELTVVADGFKTPAAVNFDSEGNLWALDTKAGDIFQIDVKSGEKKLVSHFQTAMDNLAFDSKDRLFVTVIPNNAIYEIDKNTGKERKVKWSALSAPADIDVRSDDGHDTIYLSEVFALKAIDGDTGAVLWEKRNYSDELENPIGISVSDDHILAVSWFSATVQQLDRATGESQLIAHGFGAPMDAVELPEGDWLVLQAGGRLLRASGEEKTNRKVVSNGLAGAVAMVLGKSDEVYVTRTDRITRVDVATGVTKDIATGLKNPEGIALSDAGKLVVAEVGAKRLISIDPETGEIAELAGKLPIGLKGPSGAPPSHVPTGVASGSYGKVYVSSDLENAIYKVAPK